MKAVRPTRQSPHPDDDTAARRPNWFRRIGWLALIWVASVAALFVVALLFRVVLGWAGLTA